MVEELWLDISGLEGEYQVSDLGNVMSLDRKVVIEDKNGKVSKRLMKGRILKKNKSTKYQLVHIKKKSRAVHRLVAETFLENKHENMQVNHKNGIKHDNRATNLEWCTHSQNISHAYKTGLMNNILNRRSRFFYFENKFKRKLVKLKTKNEKRVICIFENKTFKFNSSSETSSFLGISESRVNFILKNTNSKKIFKPKVVNGRRVILFRNIEGVEFKKYYFRINEFKKTKGE